jgi:hypothetical protein
MFRGQVEKRRQGRFGLDRARCDKLWDFECLNLRLLSVNLKIRQSAVRRSKIDADDVGHR